MLCAPEHKILDTDYDLKAVIQHLPAPGSQTSIDEGHFITYANRGERWFRMDDNSYRNASLSSVKSPYMLFYEHNPDKTSVEEEKVA